MFLSYGQTGRIISTQGDLFIKGYALDGTAGFDASNGTITFELSKAQQMGFFVNPKNPTFNPETNALPFDNMGFNAKTINFETSYAFAAHDYFIKFQATGPDGSEDPFANNGATAALRVNGYGNYALRNII